MSVETGKRENGQLREETGMMREDGESSESGERVDTEVRGESE